MQLTMLGTGNALVTECYNTCFVLSDDGQHFLVDGGGGNGVLCQLKRAGIPWQGIHTIFVTHKHIDHILGVVWMMRMICQAMGGGRYEGETVIYGHDEVIGLLRRMAGDLLQQKQTAYLDTRLHLVPVSDGEEREILGRKTVFFDIQSTKARQFGFSMALEPGKKLTCCGDEPYQPCERSYAEGSAWLMHEAFCLHGEADVFKPYEKHHSTVKDACELAQTLGVENLLLYHTEDHHLAERKERYTAEGAQFFHGGLYVPDDLETVTL